MGFPDLTSLDDALGSKIAAMRQVSQLGRWRFHAGNQTDASAPDFDDSSWPLVQLPYTWSSAASDVWFRYRLVPEAESQGLSLAGSQLELITFLPIGATIYVDGRHVHYDRWWTDQRGAPLMLSERLQPGKPITLAIHVGQGDGFGLFISAHLRYGRLEEHLFDLELFRQQMAFTRYLADRRGDARLEAAWQEALASLSPEDLAANRWPAWQEEMARARAALAPFAPLAKEYTTYFVGHSHIDMNWLWTLAETIEVCRRDFTAADLLMERYPEFVFSQSQAATYHFMEEHYPDLFARIQERVRQGRWEITANTWVEGDLNMASGEAIVRHILQTQRYVKSRFGRTSLICWEPDTFGHPATMPQILAKSGIRYYYCCRAGKGDPIFWWEAPDGSRVLAVVDPFGYGGEITPRSAVEPVLSLEKRYGLRVGLTVYGVGDHGGGATARDIEAARAIHAAPYLPQARLSDTISFYQRLEREATTLPVVRDELNPVFQGCYTTHADIKWLNRRGESDLVSAEALAAVSALHTPYRYPQAELNEAWRLLLFHQFHDILCGAGIGATYREARERLAPVAQVTSQTMEAALAALAARLDTGPGPHPSLVVYNPLAWERTDVVRVPLRDLAGSPPGAVEDAQGRQYPVQVVGDALLFVAEKVPALGCQVYRLLPTPARPFADGVTTPDNLTLENSLLRLRLHPGSGAIEELWDKENRRLVTETGTGGWGPERQMRAGSLNRLEVQYEQPHTMSAWNLGVITRTDYLVSGAEIKAIAQGPVCGILEINRQVLHSTLKQRVVLYRNLRRIDFETEIDWREQGTATTDAPMLRATFTPFLQSAQATFEVPFAGLVRPADGKEMPAQRWADLSDEDYGLTLLNNAKYGHHAHYHTLGLTLVRSSYEPDAQPDQGLHRFTYSLYPHAGTWREAGSTQRAAELNQPLLARVEPSHPGEMPPGQPALTCQPASVLVSAFKWAEDQPAEGHDLIVRLYESHGRPASASLAFGFPVRSAEEVDLVENALHPVPITDGRLHLEFGPYEIKTLRLRTQ